MTEPIVLPYGADTPRHRASLLIRLALFVLLVATAIVAWYVVFKTPFGHNLRNRHRVAQWVGAHRVIAPTVLVIAYVILSVLMLPVWWLQALAGYCFGLVVGILWCEI